VEPTDLRLSAADGRPLAATLYAPAEPRAALVILSALGVGRGYYRRFATFFAERGVAVLSFDHRGVGGSRDVPLRQDKSVLMDWARLDSDAVLGHALARWRGLPVWALGHSFGGQSMGIVPRALDLQGLVIVAAGSGDMTLYPPLRRVGFRALLGSAGPVGAVFGYIPGWMGIGEDLPAGVVRQWAGFCATPGYIPRVLGRDACHYHRITAPLRFYNFPDDTYAPPRAADALRGWYEAAAVTHRLVAPADLGMKSIGHFGFFRPGPTEGVWAEILAAVGGAQAA
jgi:predicted alpha/beta hydrolase